MQNSLYALCFRRVMNKLNYPHSNFDPNSFVFNFVVSIILDYNIDTCNISDEDTYQLYCVF